MIALDDDTAFYLFHLLDSTGILFAELFYHSLSERAVAVPVKCDVPLQVPKICRRMEILPINLAM